MNEYIEALKSKNPRVCTTCKILKKERMKHCKHCDCCVPVFDHHCDNLATCIGRDNAKFFLMFQMVDFACAIFFMRNCWLYPIVHRKLQAGLMTIVSTQIAINVMSFQSLYLACKGWTLNERENWRRYKWMHKIENRNGKQYRIFSAKYDKGCVKNLYNLCCAHREKIE